MNDKELIEEAREWSSSYASWGDNGLVDRLADALAKATVAHQPREAICEDDREALARALFIASDDFAFADRMAKAWDAPGPHGRQRWYRYADAVIAKGFSRAAVPDAATELRAERDAALAAIERVTAERDSAMARIAKAWELHEPFTWSFGYGPVQTCKWCADHGVPQDVASWPCPTVAALDGAPEPEGA